MKFQPLSDEELNHQRGILSEGPADFEVVNAIDGVSKAGNPMLTLQLKVCDREGQEGIIFDYLTSNAQWKIKHFLVSIGSPQLYENGNIDAISVVGKSGKARIRIERDKTGKYGDQAKIKDYVVENLVSHSSNAMLDDVPF